MQIEAKPRDRDTLIALLPEYEGEQLRVPFGGLRGKEVRAPEGVTVRFDRAMQYRSVDVAPDLTFILTVAAGVSSGLIVEWIKGHFRGRTIA